MYKVQVNLQTGARKGIYCCHVASGRMPLDSEGKFLSFTASILLLSSHKFPYLGTLCLTCAFLKRT